MAQFYVSHAYEDRSFASTLISWLGKHAFSPGLSTFVRTPRFDDNKNHPTQAVKAIQESDAVVMLCSKAWAECKQCYAEYVAAQASGKFVVALIIKKSGKGLTLAPDIPRFVVDKVGRDMTDMISVLSAFERADPYCYDWTPDQRPYPGIRAFNADEAGVFFGRDNDIQNAVARISARLVDETNCLTVLVGPTGSGVSSLLSAGVLPTLARNSADNFVLPVTRPRLQPVDALAVSIATALETPDNWRRWADRLTRAMSSDLSSFVERCVGELRDHFGVPDARIVVPIDQLEELFEVSNPEQARAFEAFVAVASASDLPVHIVATLGSEHVKTFKNSRLGVCNWKPIAIEPIPLDRYGELIRGPAQRAGVFVEDALVERLMADAAEISEDRLSLFAYLLRMFWRLEAPLGQFSIALYEQLNSGDIELPTLKSAIALGAELAIEDANTSFGARRTVGPALVNLAVRWDAKSRPVRTPFALEEVPRDKIELIDRLYDAGLVTKVRIGDQHLGEIASLALFRQWPRFERILRAQTEGPDIVLSHCREISCVVVPPEDEKPAVQNHLWQRSASVLGETMTAAVCALAVIIFMGPLGQGEPPETPVWHTVASVATPLVGTAPPPVAPRRDEAGERVTTPAGERSDGQQAPFEDFAPQTIAALTIPSESPEPVSDTPLRGHTEEATVALASEHSAGQEDIPEDAAPQSVAELSSTVEVEDVPPAFGASSFDETGGPAIALEGENVAGQIETPESPAPQSVAELSGPVEVEDVPPALGVSSFDETGGPDIAMASEQSEGPGELPADPEPQSVSEFAAPVEIEDVSPAIGVSPFDETGGPDIALASEQSEGPGELPADPEPQSVSEFATPVEVEDVSPAFGAPSFDETGGPAIALASGYSAGDQSPAAASLPSDVVKPEGPPESLPTDLLSKIIDLKPPEAARADTLGSALDEVSERPSTIELPELLKIIQKQPSQDRDTTQMLLAMEALLHPKAALLTGQERASLGQLVRRNLERHFEPRSFRIQNGRIFAAAFSPGGKQIASASEYGVSRLWDAESGDEVEAFEGHEGAIYGVAYNRDGSKLVTASGDHTARVWNIGADGGNIILTGHGGAVYRAAFDDEGERIVTASADGRAIVWDAKTGKQLKTLEGHYKPVWSAVFSRNGERILTTSKDRTARIWRSDSGELVTILEGHDADVVTGVFSPDGKTIATGSRDGSVRIWNASDGQQTAHLPGHTGTVFGTQFSNDGLFLVTASLDGTARIWELATGQMVADFKVEKGGMRAAELSTDGRFLRTVSEEGAVSIWPVALTPNHLLDSVLRVTNGCLSAEKRRALDLTAGNPWWCKLSRADTDFDVARTER